MRQCTTWVIIVLLCAGVSAAEAEDKRDTLPQVPTAGMVTMLDLGAHKCIPCKMMAPILKKLKQEYDGKASILFIDVRQHRKQGHKYGIRTIPTQIFFDKKGKEVYRHQGFLSEEAIIRQLAEMGINRVENNDVKDSAKDIAR